MFILVQCSLRTRYALQSSIQVVGFLAKNLLAISIKHVFGIIHSFLGVHIWGITFLAFVIQRTKAGNTRRQVRINTGSSASCQNTRTFQPLHCVTTGFLAYFVASTIAIAAEYIARAISTATKVWLSFAASRVEISYESHCNNECEEKMNIHDACLIVQRKPVNIQKILQHNQMAFATVVETGPSASFIMSDCIFNHLLYGRDKWRTLIGWRSEKSHLDLPRNSTCPLKKFIFLACVNIVQIKF